MSELADAATRAAIVAALRARVTDAYDHARAEVGERMDPGDRKAAHLGGKQVGHVLVATGSTRAKITDPDAFAAWVAANHPDEMVASVRASYQSKVLADAKTYGHAVDVTTGELIPGVEVSAGEPYVTVRLAEDAGDIIAANWAAALHHVPELPGGGA